MKNFGAAACLSALFLARPAAAMTGAELIQMDREFASGYIFGMVEYKTQVLEDSNPSFYIMRECILGAKLNSYTLYELVTSYIRRNPATLPQGAVGAVIQSLNAMCPDAFK
jgi:hypothetical protein